MVECHPALLTHYVLSLQVNLDQGYHCIRIYSSTTRARTLLFQDVLIEVGVVVECHPALVTHHVLGLQVNLDQGYHYINKYPSTTRSRILLFQDVLIEVGV